MKEAGANKDLLKGSRKNLAAAFGTYAIRPAAKIAMSTTSRVVGKQIGKRKGKKNDNNQEKSNLKE